MTNKRLGVPYALDGDVRIRFYDVEESLIEDLRAKGFQVEETEPEYASLKWDVFYFNSDDQRVYDKGNAQHIILANLGLA